MTKKKAAKKSTKATKEPRTNQPIPFAKIAKLYTDGKTMEQIAKGVNRFNADYPDPTKSIRAVVSGMITRGYKNDAGRTVKLKKRARTVPGGTKKASKQPKASKPTTKASKSVQKPRIATKPKVEPVAKVPRKPKVESTPELAAV